MEVLQIPINKKYEVIWGGGRKKERKLNKWGLHNRNTLQLNIDLPGN